MARQIKGLNRNDIEVLLQEIPDEIETDCSEESDTSDTEFGTDTSVAGPSKPTQLMSQDELLPESNTTEENLSDSDSEVHDIEIQRRWRKKTVKTTVPIFTLHKGAVREYFEDLLLPTDYFLRFFDEVIVNNIVFQTNLYSIQQNKKFQPLKDVELYGFLGLQFLFGYHHLPCIRDYWSCEIDLGVPIVSQTMPRDRYFQILSNLHVNDNESRPTRNKDKLYKIRPLIDSLNKNFQMLAKPDQYQSIDESMVLFKGRSSIKQYNPMKPIKRGYKLWCRSDMTGYVYQFDVYQGKNGDENGREKCVYGLGGSVVLNLTQSLENKNYIIIMDNYFSSPSLFDYLKSQGILACGTVRANRKGLPPLASDKQLKRGDFDYRITDQGLVYVKWKDNRSVHLISNYHGTENESVSRTQKDGSSIQVPAPALVKDYNIHMGGVDKADMLRSLYEIDRKSKKWWHRLFYAFVEMTLVNSYILFCEIEGKIPLLTYKRRVTMGLLTKGKANQKKRGRPSTQEKNPSILTECKKRRKGKFSVPKDVRLQNRGSHWPEFVGARGRCEMCSSRKTESRPHSKCTQCNVFLCLNEKKNCFSEYHKD